MKQSETPVVIKVVCSLLLAVATFLLCFLNMAIAVYDTLENAAGVLEQIWTDDY